MSEFLTTYATTARIEKLMSDAKDRLALISPYLRFSQLLYERLSDADRRGVRTVFVYGKDELKPSERAKLEALLNISIYYCNHVHAKCYFNEYAMIISSLNLVEFSQNNNREMSVAVFSGDKIYKDALRESQSIIEAARLEHGAPVDLLAGGRTRATIAADAMGFCIRCSTRIPVSVSAPLCGKCYAVWAEFGNPHYEEQVCHRCGTAARTTRRNPFCLWCAIGSK